MLSLFADADAMTGGGIVGGIVTAAGALYLIWEKVSKRRTEAEKERLVNAEQQLKIDAMARESIAGAYDELMRVRKAAHDTDIANLKLEIATAKARLAELESRETTCQKVCDALEAKCESLQTQNAEQAKEIIELRAKIEGLEAKLRTAGTLADTKPHTPLGGGP